MKRLQVIADIKKAIAAAEMSRASFGNEFGAKRDAYTDQIKEVTRLYRETWIIGPLRNALAELENGK